MKRVLVARLDNAGDVLLAGPAVRAVAHSADHVCFLAGPRGAAAAALLPGVDSVVEMRAPWMDLEPDEIERSRMEATVDEIAALHCDQAVILTSAYQSALPLALLLRMAGVRQIGGISLDRAGTLLDTRIRFDLAVHEVERALSIARACGFDLPPGDDGSLRIRRTYAAPRVPPGFMLLHPGGTAPARRWAEQRWMELAAALAACGHHTVLTGGESEAALCERIAAGAAAAADGASSPRPLSLAGQTTLPELVELIAVARCVVVGNTGPAHIAAAMRAPVVSLFAPTVPASRWHPWATPHVLLGDQEIACAGCRAVDCPVAGHPCVDSVSPARVVRAIDALLSATHAQPPLGVPA